MEGGATEAGCRGSGKDRLIVMLAGRIPPNPQYAGVSTPGLIVGAPLCPPSGAKHGRKRFPMHSLKKTEEFG